MNRIQLGDQGIGLGDTASPKRSKGERSQNFVLRLDDNKERDRNSDDHVDSNLEGQHDPGFTFEFFHFCF